MTFRRDDEGVKIFEERPRALASVHDILVQRHWGPAGLLEVIERALSGLSVRDRIRLDGEDVQLKPNSVLAYLLGFHELAVNAVKYGALSTPYGSVELKWRIDDEKVHVLWRECGGPKPAPERRTGSGSMLLQRVVATELGTPISLRFEETGVVCEFDGPIQKASLLPEVERPSSS